MLRPGHYARAPIIEAAISIDTQPLADTVFERAKSAIKTNKDYPHHEQVTQNNVSFAAPVGGSRVQSRVDVNEKVIAYQARRHDNRRLVEFRRDSFAFHHAAPYSSWTEFSSEARTWWHQYRSLGEATPITRISLQYANQIDLPIEDDCVDFSTYFTTLIALSDSTPSDGFGNYFFRVDLRQDDIGCTATVQQGVLNELLKPGALTLPMLFEINLFKGSNLPQEDESIWSLLAEMRVRKNEIFEATLTEVAKEMFV